SHSKNPTLECPPFCVSQRCELICGEAFLCLKFVRPMFLQNYRVHSQVPLDNQNQDPPRCYRHRYWKTMIHVRACGQTISNCCHLSNRCYSTLPVPRHSVEPF